MDLSEFLLARIAEDEDLARMMAQMVGGVDLIPGPVSPGRILAECSAKRQIVETYERLWQHAEELRQAGRDANAATARAIYSGVEMVVGYLALPYADHSDYDPEWRP